MKKQVYYPEGYYHSIRIDKQQGKGIFHIIADGKVVSAKVLAFIAEKKSNRIEVDLGVPYIGILPCNNEKDIYKNKSLVNEVINFRIVKHIGDNYFLLERESLIKEARKEILQSLEPGDIIVGKVVSFLGYGAIVDIGWGNTALLHKSDMLGSQELTPKELLRGIDFFNVQIKEIKEDGSIYLRMVK